MKLFYPSFFIFFLLHLTTITDSPPPLLSLFPSKPSSSPIITLIVALSSPSVACFDFFGYQKLRLVASLSRIVIAPPPTIDTTVASKIVGVVAGLRFISLAFVSLSFDFYHHWIPIAASITPNSQRLRCLSSSFSNRRHLFYSSSR